MTNKNTAREIADGIVKKCMREDEHYIRKVMLEDAITKALEQLAAKDKLIAALKEEMRLTVESMCGESDLEKMKAANEANRKRLQLEKELADDK